MKRIFSNLLFLIFTFSFAQFQNDIELPKNGLEVNLKSISKRISIYITKEQHVYFENQRLTDYTQISGLLSQTLRKNPPDQLPSNIAIYLLADINLYLDVLEKIKIEIAKVGIKKVHYQTGSIDNPLWSLVDVIPKSLYQIDYKSPIPTLEQRLALPTNNIKQETLLTTPPAPIYNYYNHLRHLFSSSNKKEETLQILAKVKHANIILHANKKIRYLENEISIEDKKAIEDILKNHQIVFLHFDPNIKYGDYMKFKYLIKKIKEPYYDKKQYDQISSILEISHEQESLHKEIGLNLYHHMD